MYVDGYKSFLICCSNRKRELFVDGCSFTHVYYILLGKTNIPALRWIFGSTVVCGKKLRQPRVCWVNERDLLYYRVQFLNEFNWAWFYSLIEIHLSFQRRFHGNLVFLFWGNSCINNLFNALWRWMTDRECWLTTNASYFFLLSRFDVIVPRCPSYRVIQSKGEWKSLIHSMMMVFMRTISASTVQWHWHIMLPGDDHKSSPFSHMPHTEFDATNDWRVINSWTRKHHTDTHTHTAHNSHALTHTICADESTWLRYV